MIHAFTAVQSLWYMHLQQTSTCAVAFTAVQYLRYVHLRPFYLNQLSNCDIHHICPAQIFAFLTSLTVTISYLLFFFTHVVVIGLKWIFILFYFVATLNSANFHIVNHIRYIGWKYTANEINCHCYCCYYYLQQFSNCDVCIYSGSVPVILTFAVQ